MKARLALLLAATGALVAAAPAAAAERGIWSGAAAVAVSPDGTSVYAPGVRTISFSRDPATGELTEIDGIAPGGNAVAVTPDGKWVYVGAGGGDYSRPGAIHVLARDEAGLLTHTYSYTREPGAPAIGAVEDVAVSPDGRQLYVAQSRDNAVIVLRRDPATGELAFAQALFDGPGEVQTLGRPGDIDLSGDGRTLYVAGGAYVNAFARDPASGLLTAAGATPSQYGSAFHVAVAPDGARVYAGRSDYEVFDRDAASGALSSRGRTDFTAGCEQCYFGGPIAVSPDSATLLSGEPLDDRLFQASPTPDGAALTHTYTSGAGGIDGLSDVGGLAWSPDGRSLYLTTQEGASRDMYAVPDRRGYVLALAWDGSRLRELQRIQPSFPLPGYPRDEQPGLSIAGGAIYVNDPEVELKLVPPGLAPASIRISNDPGFETSELRRVEESQRYRWRLDTSGPPERSVRHVYVRFTSDGSSPATELSDDVILDRIAPRVLAAKLRAAGSRSRLSLRARDNRSGVRKLQVAAKRSRPGRARRFSRRVTLRAPRRQVWVRVIDGAGNRSRWKRAAR